MPGEGTTVLRGALLEESDPGSGFVARQAVRWPLRVAYADHSRLEHHGAAAGHVVVVLLRAFEQAYIGFWCSNVSGPAGVAPEALEECLHSSKGYKRRPV